MPIYFRARPHGDLYGHSFFSSAQIDSYIDWSLVNLEVPALLQVLPLMGRMEKNFAVVKKAQADFENGLKRLEADLALRTFIVGDRLSLADVIIATILYYPMKFFMDAAYRRKYPNLTRYFSFVVATPSFFKTVGFFVPCVVAKNPLFAGGKGGKKKNKGGKKQKKKQQQQPKRKNNNNKRKNQSLRKRKR